MADGIHDDTLNDNHLSNSNGFGHLDDLKRQMEFRGSELGKTWSELSRIMTQYQTQLVQKHETFKSNLGPDDKLRVAKLEALIEKKSLHIQKLEKSNSDLETRLFEKDTEIVQLRMEVHQSRNEVTMKDALIEKVQKQMTKEASEYQTELNSLKEMLLSSSGGGGGGGMVETVDTPGATGKRRRLKPPRTASTSVVKYEIPIQDTSFLSSQVRLNQSQTVQIVDDDNSGQEMEAYSNQDHDEYYKLDETGDDSLHGSDFAHDDEHGQELGQQDTVPQLKPENVNPEKRPPAECPVCGRILHYTGLARHLRSHAGAKPHKCALCDRSFTQKHLCRAHVRRTHTDEILNVHGDIDDVTIQSYIVSEVSEDKHGLLMVKHPSVVKGKNLYRETMDMTFEQMQGTSSSSP